MKSLALLMIGLAWARPPLPVPEFKIDLDKAPEDRFTEVIKHFQGPLYDVYAHNVLKSPILKPIVASFVKQFVKHRGDENEELMGEIRGMSAAMSEDARIPADVLHLAQFLYELQSIMVPIENITFPWGPHENETLQRSPVQFGCTGIIAQGSDGTVYHARNLDFSFAHWLGNMTYNGVFYKGGKELYTAQMIAGYANVLTGIRRGANGYTIEINTRFPSKKIGLADLWKHIFTEKRTPSGWTKRKTMEEVDNYEDAVKAFSTTPYAAPEYNIISGVKKGTILARDPDGVTHQLVLGPNPKDYIIMTNFDYWDHDIKEWFDPTGVEGIGHSRRIGAERILNKTDTITGDVLLKVLNDRSVMAKDTIFQAIINVQKDSYTTNLPDCESCDGCRDQNVCRKANEVCCGIREHYTLSCAGPGKSGYRCGAIPDGACRFLHVNENRTRADADCESYSSHFDLRCAPSNRRCGPKPTVGTSSAQVIV